MIIIIYIGIIYFIFLASKLAFKLAVGALKGLLYVLMLPISIIILLMTGFFMLPLVLLVVGIILALLAQIFA